VAQSRGVFGERRPFFFSTRPSGRQGDLAGCGVLAQAAPRRRGEQCGL